MAAERNHELEVRMLQSSANDDGDHCLSMLTGRRYAA